MFLSSAAKPGDAANRFRMARVGFVQDLIRRILAEKGSCDVIDIGGLPRYWTTFAPEIVANERVRFTLVNIAYAEGQGDHDGRFRLEIGDARDLSTFEDNGFDLAHSNSVIEHVGRWVDMQAMARETLRISRFHFVQTPYWGFPIEPHNRTPAFHWLPEQLRYRLVMNFRLGFWAQAKTVDEAMRAVQSNALLDRRQFGSLFPDSSIYSEMAFGLTKSLIAIGGETMLKRASSNTRRLRL